MRDRNPVELEIHTELLLNHAGDADAQIDGIACGYLSGPKKGNCNLWQVVWFALRRSFYQRPVELDATSPGGQVSGVTMSSRMEKSGTSCSGFLNGAWCLPCRTRTDRLQRCHVDSRVGIVLVQEALDVHSLP